MEKESASMGTELRDRISAWVWGVSLATGVALMLRPLPQRADDVLEVFPQADLLFHFSFFLYLRLVPHITNWGSVKGKQITAGLIVFGVLLELAQTFTATRSPVFGDAIANTAGVLAGTKLGALLGDGWRNHDG